MSGGNLGEKKSIMEKKSILQRVVSCGDFDTRGNAIDCTNDLLIPQSKKKIKSKADCGLGALFRGNQR